jgi:hypothetical protein
MREAGTGQKVAQLFGSYKMMMMMMMMVNTSKHSNKIARKV